MKNRPAWAISKSGYPKVINANGSNPAKKSANALVDALKTESKRKPSSSMKVTVNPEPLVINANFHQVLPDSHFWSDLTQLKNFLFNLPASETQKYLLKGIENTIANGYKLTKINEVANVGLNGSNLRPMSFEKFRTVLAAHKPKELFHSMYSVTTPIFRVTSYAVGAKRESDWYVRGYYTNWSDKTPKKFTFSRLYRDFSVQGLINFYFEPEK